MFQDIRYALRQLGKTPAFTLTVLLTLALGIGANAAIFTLVHAVLLKSLPVADPKTLVRLGDRNDCCVGSGISDSGDYSLFSTDTYLRDSADLLELAAPESLLSGSNSAGRIELAHRHALGPTIYGGTSEIHRSIIAEQALGMPRTRN